MLFDIGFQEHIYYTMANEKIGGPKDIKSLFSIDELKTDFPNYEIIESVELEIELNEGLYHNGKGSVIRSIERKT